jgi:PAS domain S-box-containing protein
MNHYHMEGLAQALFESSDDALFLLDPDTDQVLDANAAAQRLTGLPLHKLLQVPLATLVQFGGPEGIGRLRQAAAKTGTFRDQEGYTLCTLRRGVRMPVTVTVSRLHVHPKDLALIAARDARAQQAARARLRQAEEELRQALGAVQDCLWSAEIDATGRWTYHYFSPAVESLTGQPPHFFLAGAHRWWGTVHPDDRTRWERALAHLHAGRPTDEEYRLLRPDGSCRWVRERVRPSPGRSLRLDGVVSDITERRQGKAGVGTGEQCLSTLFDASPVLVFLEDPEGSLLYANPAFAAVCGRTPAEVVGRTAEAVLPSALAALRHRAALAAGEIAAGVEDLPARGGGKCRWLLLRLAMADPSGRPCLAGLAAQLDGGAVPGASARPA